MKIPAFVAKPILSCFLFLVACFLFLLVTPNLTKPALAASCRVNTLSSIPQGFTINVGTDGVDTSLPTQLVLNPGANRLGPIKVDSTSGPTAADYAVNVSIGSYNAVVVVGSGTPFYIPCGGGTDGSGGVVVTPASTPPPAVCTYRFTPQGSVSAGGAVSVEITRIDSPGTSGDTIEAGFAQGATHSQQQTRTGTGPIPLIAPSTAGDYLVYATDLTHSGLCALESGSSAITVGSAPPTTGCPLTPTNTSWGTLPQPQVSGNNVTFDLSSNPPTGNYGIGVYDTKTGQLAKDSGLITGPNWSSTLPDGTYCAGVYAFVNTVSNVVTFTVPSDTGDTCTSSALNWANDFRCRAIGGGWFDSDVFSVGQGYATLEFFTFTLYGESPANPRWATDTTKKTGALALTGTMVASLYSAPPASGVQYFAQKIHDVNPVQPAFAAAGGIGYQALGPVQKIWIAFRNISYVGFIIVFVIMGFMIMFRAHISPQAVATVQDSIPRIVVALILVTFSYAIAGFMIDLMFLFLNITISALNATGLLTTGDFIFQHNVFGLLWGDTWKQVFSTVATAINGVIQGSLNLPGGFLGDIAEKTIGWTGGTIAGLVVGVAILFIMFRVFLMLLMAYVMIILLTMFAPFFFLIQALPGNNGAKEWFRQMASNIAVFPTVALMFMLAGIIGGISALGGQGQGVISPEKVGQFPLLTGGMNQIPRLIGIGFLLMTPSAADIVKNAFGGKSSGGGAMGAAAPAMAALGASAGFLGRRASESSLGQATSAMGKYGGERRTEWLINKAPGFMKGGNKKLQMGLPTLRERETKDR